MASKVNVFIRGKILWAKILGDPVFNYNKDAKEWTFEVEPDEDSIQKIIKNGLTDRIKGRGYNIGTKGQHKDREPFLQLRKKELMADGTPNSPLRVYDDNDKDWDRDVAIGNGTVADVKLDVRDYGVGKKKGMYPAAIRVRDLVPYESSEFGGMADDFEPAEKPKKTKKNSDFGLDDELPF